MRTQRVVPEHDRALIERVRDEVGAALRAAGIPERPTIRLGHADDGRVASYVSLSQIKSRPAVRVDLDLARSRLPADATPAALRALVRHAVLHEYGHAVREWARRTDPALAAAIEAVDPEPERFAAAVAAQIAGTALDDAVAALLARYAETVFARDPLRSQFGELAQRELPLGRRRPLRFD